MEKEEVLSILDNLQAQYQEYQNDCTRKICFCMEHKFNMEADALRYEKEAYEKCITELVLLRHKLFETL